MWAVAYPALPVVLKHPGPLVRLRLERLSPALASGLIRTKLDAAKAGG